MPAVAQDEPENRKISLNNPYMVLVTMFATLGGLLFGYDQGVVSTVATMENFGYHFPRIYEDASYKGWWVSTFLLAAWFGSLTNSPIADRLGRKRSIMAACLVFTIGCIFQTIAINDAMMFAGRAISGIAVGMLTMVVPMYISELADASSRGAMVVLQQVSITFGILISYWVDYGCNYIGGTRCDPDTPYSGGTADEPKFNPRKDAPNGCTAQSTASWRVPLAIQMAPALVLFFGMMVLPYSPRWLCSKNRDEEALKVLGRLRRRSPTDELVVEEHAKIKAEVLFEQTNIPSHLQHLSGVKLYFAQYWDLLTHFPSFKRVFIGSAVMFFQQFIGCNAIIYYAPTIFSQLGLSGNLSSLLASGVYGIVNFLSTIPAVFLVDRLGRKTLLMAGAVGTFISLVIVGSIVAKYGDDLKNNKHAGWAAIAFVYIYDINFSYSYAPIGWLLPSEIFSISIRSKAISITTSATWMCNFIIGLVSPMMLENIGSGTYFFFAGFAIIAFFFTWFIIPETKGRTLEEMDAVFGDTNAAQDKRAIAAVSGDGINADDLRKQSLDHLEKA